MKVDVRTEIRTIRNEFSPREKIFNVRAVNGMEELEPDYRTLWRCGAHFIDIFIENMYLQ